MHYFKQSVLGIVAIGIGITSLAQGGESLKGWHLKDRAKDGYYGISLDKAYEFVKGKKSQTVVVAVIDSGIDTTHEDLRSVLWVNQKEVPANGIDDDKNGYVDDVHGWNFIGGRDGRNVKEDSYEVTRVYHKYKDKFRDVTDPSKLNREEAAIYKSWKKAESEVVGNASEGKQELFLLRRSYAAAKTSDSLLQQAMNKKQYTGNDLDAFTPADEQTKKAKNAFLYFFQANNSMDMTNASFMDEFHAYLSSQERKAEAADNAPKAYRAEIVKDNYNDFNDRYYGNNDLMANTPFHGTHVAGIIAASRGNKKGIDGIADNVRIMAIRAVPDGDEHDKDIALAIRYAVDNGAKIINMSFGKGYSPEKNWVDEAVQYAESKGVLLVHAAGNSGQNIDSTDNFPNAVYLSNNKKAGTWITVGASGDPKVEGIVAPFSNYGKDQVDVFAPGMKIYSTIPGGNQYGDASGTSMASPVVAGTAAFVWSYFPQLSAQQVKQIIETSAIRLDTFVIRPGSGGMSAKPEKVYLSDLSRTGGLLNAYEAVRMAAQMSGGAPAQVTKPAKKEKKARPVKSF